MEADLVLDAAAPMTAAHSPRDRHIVGVLIEERATKLMRSPFWPLYKRALNKILLYRSAVEIVDAVADMNAHSVFDHVSKTLELNLAVTGLEQVPEKGRVLIAPTHPSGIADGAAIYDALKPRRRDMTFFANRDAVRAAPGLADMIIPVEWVEEKRTPARSRETLVETIKSFKQEKCVVLFPSGRIARMNREKELVEQDWLPSVAIFARKYHCPVVPAYIEMRNSPLYYWLWNFNTEMRDMTLFHELLNKKGKLYKIAFGAAIPPEALRGDASKVAARLREHAVGLRDKPEAQWRPCE